MFAFAGPKGLYVNTDATPTRTYTTPTDFGIGEPDGSQRWTAAVLALEVDGNVHGTWSNRNGSAMAEHLLTAHRAQVVGQDCPEALAAEARSALFRSGAKP